MPIIQPDSLLQRLFERKKGGSTRKGLSTGFDSIDEHMLLVKQYLMVITGLPSSGKSEVLDAIAVNVSSLHGWNWLYYSPENFPLESHLQKLVEKKLGNHLTKCSDSAIVEAVEWVNKHFSWINPQETKFALQDILDETEERIQSGHRIDALVIDPWNELDHSAQGGRDDIYIGQCLTKVRKFHRKYDLLTCIVIHPHGMEKNKDGNYPVPALRNCNGGPIWWAKADYGLCVHRADMSVSGAEVFIQKVKTKDIGAPGKTFLDYDVPSGRFKDQRAHGFYLPELAPF